MSRFRFVDDHRDLYEVKRLCELAEVSRAGYYAWRNRPASARELADADLGGVLVEIHEAPGAPTGVHGSRGSCVAAGTA